MSKLRRRHPWLAVTLSLLIPGLGQFYAGAIARGIAFIAAIFVLTYGAIRYLNEPAVGLGMFYLYAGLTGLVYLFSLVVSYTSAISYNGSKGLERLKGPDPWLATFLTFLVPGLGHLYLKRIFFAAGSFLFWCGLQVLVFYFKWLFPALPVFTVFLAVHAHLLTPGGRERRRGLVLMTVVAFVVLLAGTALVMTYRGRVASVYSSKVGVWARPG